MKIIFAWFFGTLCVLAACLSCQDTLMPVVQPDSETSAAKHFTATTESPATKTELSGNDTDGYVVNWQNGDKITIVDAASTPNVGVYTTTSTAVKADFTFVSGSGAEATTAPYKAYYPETLYNNGSLTLPATQTYVAGNIGQSPMYAESNDESLKFKNLCGIVRLNITTTQSGKKVKSIILSADQGMSGTFTISDNAAVISSGTTGVTLDCGEGTTIGETAIPFFFSVPAGDYTGLNITVVATDGSFQTRSAKNTITVERSKMTDISLAFNNLILITELTVYDGTVSNSYVPVYGYYADAFLKCEFVIPAAQLTAMNGKTITEMKFYLQSPASAAWTGTFLVFMKEVTETTLSTFSGNSDATIVYEGSLDGTGSVMTVPFSSSYSYNSGNLLIGFYQTAKSGYYSATFYGQTVSGACVQGHNSSNLDIITPTQRNFIPKTTFVLGGE